MKWSIGVCFMRVCVCVRACVRWGGCTQFRWSRWDSGSWVELASASNQGCPVPPRHRWSAATVVLQEPRDTERICSFVAGFTQHSQCHRQLDCGPRQCQARERKAAVVIIYVHSKQWSLQKARPAPALVWGIGRRYRALTAHTQGILSY